MSNNPFSQPEDSVQKICFRLASIIYRTSYSLPVPFVTAAVNPYRKHGVDSMITAVPHHPSWHTLPARSAVMGRACVLAPGFEA